ncbi:SLC13/DASS family transporter [candidate division KSB1 bacterium]|nr:SLC13/DASS family transporter [candidate division KSB1 bacterium]
MKSERYPDFRTIAFWAGPVIALLFISAFDLDPEHPAVTRTAAVAIWMALWWITEVIPLAATALLPLVLFPIMNILPGKQVAPQYFNHIIVLFLGGFIVAIAMQRWQLHKRIALKMMLWIGVSPSRIILGFMSATAFLSMWISNTATTMMMIPIALAVISKMDDLFDAPTVSRFSIGLLLGIAYSASLGGMATLIGTPPNLIFVRMFEMHFPGAPTITFAQWMLFATPLALCFFIILWLLLVRLFAPPASTREIDEHFFENEYARLGPITFEETIVLIDFVLLGLLWLTRNGIQVGSFNFPGWAALFPDGNAIDDGTVAITMALFLFLIPSKRAPGTHIMDWTSVKELPWNIVLLFGGGFALAAGFKESGLSSWIGSHLTSLDTLPIFLVIIILCGMLTFLTEVTSNTATANMIMPILASIGVAIKLNPLVLMIPAALSVSCAFMLPVATPPNAIVFGTQRLKVSDMARVGIILNLIGMILIALAVYIWGKWVFDIQFDVFPTWAK